MKKRYQMAKFIQKLSREQKGLEIKFPDIRLNKEGRVKSKKRKHRLNYDENFAYFDEDFESHTEDGETKNLLKTNGPQRRGRTLKREKVDKPEQESVALRRSRRSVPPVRYNVDNFISENPQQPGPLMDDSDYHEKSDEDDLDSEESECDWETAKPPAAKKAKKSKKTQNNRQKKNIKESRKVVKKARHQYIYCEDCKDEKLGGCSEHQLKKDVVKDCTFQIAQSNIKNAGLGCWNNGERIPKNTLLGTYKGRRLGLEELTEQKKTGTESGYAWEIKDDNMKVVGAIDPGVEPDQATNPLAFVNCPNKVFDCNLEAVQFEEDIYYRTTKDIERDQELYVYYGNDYAQNELHIDTKALHRYEGKEDWTTDVHKCNTCKKTFSSQRFLEDHNCLTGRPKNKTPSNSGINNAENKCPVCSKTYYDASTLQRHFQGATEDHYFVDGPKVNTDDIHYKEASSFSRVLKSWHKSWHFFKALF